MNRELRQASKAETESLKRISRIRPAKSKGRKSQSNFLACYRLNSNAAELFSHYACISNAAWDVIYEISINNIKFSEEGILGNEESIMRICETLEKPIVITTLLTEIPGYFTSKYQDDTHAVVFIYWPKENTLEYWDVNGLGWIEKDEEIISVASEVGSLIIQFLYPIIGKRNLPYLIETSEYNLQRSLKTGEFMVEAGYCQTWIWVWVYLRIVLGCGWKKLNERLFAMSIDDRLQFVNLFWSILYSNLDPSLIYSQLSQLCN